MRFTGKHRKNKRGVGSIIGATFLALILLSGFAFYAAILNTTDHYNETLGSMGETDWYRSLEKIVIQSIRTTTTKKLNLTVENKGSIQSRLIWLGIINKSVTPESQTYYPLSEYIESSETKNIISDFSIQQDKKYAVQLVTDLGNVIENKFYPASAVRCALTLTVAPPTAYLGNNITVFLTVSHNDTEVDTIQSLTVTIQASPSGLVQLKSNSPLSVEGLRKGESAFFWWVYNTIATGTVTFNASYSQAPAGKYTLSTANMESAPSGGAGSITITGVNGTASYNPSQWNLLGSTQYVSGSISDLANDDVTYVVFRSYQTASSGQPLYAHGETTTISGTPYYLQKLTSADGAATSLSASMGTVGRQLFGKFVYSLAGVSSIPASTWTTYYRTWKDVAPSITFDSVGSGNNGGGSTSISWSHTTGSGSNRIMVVGVSIRTTTVSVSSINYGAQSLTFIRADTHASATIRSELWYLIAPVSGTATVTVTLSGSSKATGGSCTYTGAAQTSPIDVSSGVTGTSSSPSRSVTVGTANSMLLGHVAISGSDVTVSGEGSGQTLRWDQVTTNWPSSSRNRGHGSDKGPVGTGSQTMSWTLSSSADWAVSVVAIKPVPAAVGHADIDILIRQSDGTIRLTIATNVAVSAGLTSTPTTLSGTYAWTAYTVVDQSDYLEIDYYVDVTTAASGTNAYLRIDDTTLAISDQTRTANIMLPSEYTAEVEFTGSSNLLTWTQLICQVDSAWDIGQVTATIQLYNYTLGAYATSGNGYVNYVSSPSPNTNELKNKTATLNPAHFRNNSTGYWKVKIRGIKATVTQFLMKVDWIDLETSYSSSGNTVPYNAWHWYTIKATAADGSPVPYYYISIYANGTNVAFRDALNKSSVANPAWVRLNAVGVYYLEMRSTNPTAQIFVLSVAAGSVVGQKTITQGAP